MKSLGNSFSKYFTSKKAILFFSFVGIYLLSTGASLAIFSYLKKEPNLTTASPGGLEGSRSKISQLPKTEECPINGLMFSKPEEEIWLERRPIVSVIENHLDARPQSGLSKADLIYEVVAEGGITRFLSIFYCNSAAQDVRIGPIRSARIYLINWATEYGDSPLFVHVGGANSICKTCPGGVKFRGDVAKEVLALEELIKLGWRYSSGNALDAGANAGFPVVWRDYERIPGAATEHTYMGSTDKLYNLGIERGFGYKNGDGKAWDENLIKWRFVDDKPLSTPTATEISFEFWSNKPDYSVTWKYDSKNNTYLRFNADKPHIDMDTNVQLSAKNLVIQFVPERGPVDKEGHMFYTTIGEGKIIVFQNGDVIQGTWKKVSQTSRTKFFDEQGKEISFVRGVTWIEAVPKGNTIKY